jgi:hypothetical protein
MRSGRLKAFDADRAKTDRASTSRLSPHIHYGEVSVRHMHYVAKHQQLEWARCVVGPWRGGMLGGCVPWGLHAGQSKRIVGGRQHGIGVLCPLLPTCRHAACLLFPLLQVGRGRHQRARLPAAAGLPRVSSCSRCLLLLLPLLLPLLPPPLLHVLLLSVLHQICCIRSGVGSACNEDSSYTF